MEITFGKKHWIFIFLSLVIILIGKFISPINSLSPEGNTSLFFMIGLILLLVTETLPTGFIAIAGVIFIPLLGLTSTLNDAAKLFGSQLFFYTLACFAISGVMGKLPLSRRLLYFFLKTFNKSIRQSITAILLTTALLSTFVSNFPACILMFILSKQFLQMINDEQQRKQTSKSIMVGLILSVAIGGIITPIGSSCVMLASSFLLQAGYGITFLQWICFGLPIATVSFPVMIFLLFKLLPPVEQPDEIRKEFAEKVNAEIPDKFSVQEILTVIILGITFICWVLNFNLLMVTCLCGLALIFPGFKLLTWKEFNAGTGWNTVLLICSFLAIASTMQTTGVTAWLIKIFNILIPNGASPILLLIIFGIFVSIVLLLMPNGPVLMAVLGTSIITLANIINIHPAILLIGFATYTTYSFILPIDGISLIVYEGGANFATIDEPKVGIPMAIAAIIITAFWLPICGKLLGII